MTEQSPPSGWYPDPWRQAPLRWWDGANWTGHLHLPTAMPGSWQPGTEASDAATLIDREATSLTWFMRGSALQIAVIAAMAAVLAGLLKDVFDGLSSSTTLQPTSGTPTGLGDIAKFQGAVLVFSAGSWLYAGTRIWWTLAVCKAGRSLGRRTEYDPTLHAAGWILPIVNLWFPYIGIRDSVGRDRVALLSWWWASTLALSGFALFLGLGLSLWINPVVGALAAGLAQSVHFAIERRIGQAVLAAHRSDAQNLAI